MSIDSRHLTLTFFATISFDLAIRIYEKSCINPRERDIKIDLIEMGISQLLIGKINMNYTKKKKD